MSSFINTGIAKKGNITVKDSVIVYVADNDSLIIKKTVDKPGEYYAKGDTIKFIITITLPSGAPAKIYGITFEDQVPLEVLLPTTAPYGVTYDYGNLVPVSGNLVKITGIDLDPGDICTITIEGTIA